MEISLTLSLPRDQMSVPIVRRILASAMDGLGVEIECSADIQLALTEACTNALEHSAGDEEYEVTICVDRAVCTLEVIDRGSGFDAADKGRSQADAAAENGRGIQIMRALLDKVEFVMSPTDGMVVHMEKTLVLVPGSPLRHSWSGQSDR